MPDANRKRNETIFMTIRTEHENIKNEFKIGEKQIPRKGANVYIPQMRDIRSHT